MADKNTSTGVGFLGLLTLAFIVLKLCHVIEWSWLWVLAPTWIPIGLGLLLALFAFMTDIYFKKIAKK